MTDALSKRNRFKVNRVDSGGGNSEEDGDETEVRNTYANHHFFFFFFHTYSFSFFHEILK